MSSQQEYKSESQNFAWACQAVSAAEEICKLSTTCHCPVCEKWFYSVQVEDEAWRYRHLEPTDEAVKNPN